MDDLVERVDCLYGQNLLQFLYMKKKKGLPSFLFIFPYFFSVSSYFFLPILRAKPLHLVKELDDEASEVPELTGLPK